MTGPISVLVVDDDFMVASVHQRFVARTPGFEVVGSARTGAEALALVEELRPDLVLLDVHLPDISGLEVLARLRAEGRQTGVVMVTAERGADAVRTALHGGALQYLVKPFDHDDLAARLTQVAAALGELHAGPTDQDTIDRLFGTAAPASRAPTALPKGLSSETGQLVLEALRGGAELSAAEAGEQLGLSRVSARRYLEHFVTTGEAQVRLQYGGAGRPERRYRSTATT
ncbi:Response regulator of citrate/malate metabolism [Nocardioides scoriae]|uniref:Transcriptional regulatory protein n=1 Tax=Nocardioides scoriae TaxID=642780 RepID=A0A1H1T3G4_9ACTN|nr:response regulator [Nocardioides scoriae]SDS54189.1 Response regulator of citrate/malate metabolism [Nocardioides scoriae]